MVEFIVLGEIPGTHLQITLAWFVFSVLGVLIWADMRFHSSHQNTSKHARKNSKKSNLARG